MCSGAPSWVCSCSEGWEGYNCGLRQCPKARSWFDFPRAKDEAHFAMVECAGRGLCDRTLGTCECMDGYTGASCAYLQCPRGLVYTKKSEAEVELARALGMDPSSTKDQLNAKAKLARSRCSRRASRKRCQAA